jgi:NAD(P)H-dependent FMN reductase
MSTQTMSPQTSVKKTLNILAIAGSLRSGSVNRGALLAAIAGAPAGVTVHEAAIGDIPLYNEDTQARIAILVTALANWARQLQARPDAAHTPVAA